MQPNSFFSLNKIIDRQPLSVSSETCLKDVVQQMQEWGNSCSFTEEEEHTAGNALTRNNSCALIVENSQLQGIFTERDLVKLIAAGNDLAEITVAEVMTRELITFTETGSENVFTILNLLRQHCIRHLPVIDENERLLGLITEKTLRLNLQPFDLMKWRRVGEIMTTHVIHSSPTMSVRHAAQLMTEHRVSYVVIVESERDGLLIPVGIITERDIVQFQTLNLDLAQPVLNLMSAPLFLIGPEDSLWSIHQQMQQRLVRRLVVAGAQGELQGIVTQTDLLQIFEPTEMYGIIEQLQKQLCQLEDEKMKWLQNRNAELEIKVKEETSISKSTYQQLQREINQRQQSEQRFRAIFDQVFQFIGLMQLDGTLIEANQTALDFAGLTLVEVANKPFWEAHWWTISKETQEQLKGAIAKAALGEFIRYEVDVLGREDYVATIDFSIKPVKDETGKVVMLIPEGRDITERKEAEAKIRQQAELLNVATDAIMVRDLDDKILFWNKGAEQLYGWTKEEALNQNADEFLDRESLTKLSEIQQVVRNKGTWQGEVNQVTKAGKDLVVQSRWTLVKDDGKNPQSFLVVNTDITEKKLLEAQVLRTQRLESLGTLAGGIAHDLNNILAPIMGFAKLLPLKLPNSDKQTREFFQIIETNAQRGSALVKQILTFARGLEGERGVVQIKHLIAEIKQIIVGTFPKAIELKISVPKNLWMVNGDVNQLHQVLMNLTVNARDAMPNGGTLTIKAENYTVDADYVRLHLDAAEGSYVLITVADTGAGIPPEVIGRIFEPFFTTKEFGKGTGLGLSTVIGIVKSHGGFIDVASKRSGESRGTQFKVFLPASEIRATATEETEEVPQGNGELVLVIDDELSILDVTKAILETYNYRVLTGNNGIEGIAIYAQNLMAIDLVITDIMMPSMDGKTEIRTLKQINPDLKIIAVSGLISSQEIIAEIEGEISAFIAKPYSNEDLLRTISKVIAQAEMS